MKGMIEELEERIRERWGLICRWFEERTAGLPIPVYTSVDIRNSGFKVAVVDTNLFPCGFNNLCQFCYKRGPDLFRRYFENNVGPIKRLLIIPESHTRNLPYLANLARIRSLLEKGGYEVRIGFLPDKLRDDFQQVVLTSGETVELHRIRRGGDKIFVSGFEPDLLLINNDFSTGLPEVMEGLSQPALPPPALGWHRREKSGHFHIHHRLIEDFCRLIDWDPWFLMPLTEWEKGIDFLTKDGLDRVAVKVEGIIGGIRRKYQEHGIDEEPYVFIKNNAGTYGMAIITASSGDEILRLNRKDRVKMARAKGGAKVTGVLIQEGIPTRDRFGNCWVEPVIYLVGGEVLGGFLRENCRVSPRDNFNTTGMTFTRPCLHGVEGGPPSGADYFPMTYEIISKIAAVAAGYEVKGSL